MEYLKEKIIYECLCILDNSQKNKQQLNELLQQLAGKYHIKLQQKKYVVKKYDALKKFIKNTEGYNITLPRLYNVFIYD